MPDQPKDLEKRLSQAGSGASGSVYDHKSGHVNDTQTAHLTGGHPDAETLAAYIDGLLPESVRREVEAHAAECRECREIMTETAAFLREVEGQQASVPMPAVGPVEQRRGKVIDFKRAVQGGLIGVLAVAAAVLLVVRIQRPSTPPAGAAVTTGAAPAASVSNSRAPEMVRLLAALDTQPRRAIEGRLSGGMPYKERPIVTRGENTRRVAPDVTLAATQLETAVAGQSAADQAARALAALATGEVDRAVEALEGAVRQSPADPGFLSDLSAAYLARAARSGSPDDGRLALEAADRALLVNAAMPEALFNRALALDGLDRADDARRAWQAYLKVDRDSPWGREAADRCGC
jgi:anti-sigma factor RsiW